MEEILERQLFTQGQAFATFSTSEQALPSRKKSFRGPYVVQTLRRRILTSHVFLYCVKRSLHKSRFSYTVGHIDRSFTLTMDFSNMWKHSYIFTQAYFRTV